MSIWSAVGGSKQVDDLTSSVVRFLGKWPLNEKILKIPLDTFDGTLIQNWDWDWPLGSWQSGAFSTGQKTALTSCLKPHFAPAVTIATKISWTLPLELYLCAKFGLDSLAYSAHIPERLIFHIARLDYNIVYSDTDDDADYLWPERHVHTWAETATLEVYSCGVQQPNVTEECSECDLIWSVMTSSSVEVVLEYEEESQLTFISMCSNVEVARSHIVLTVGATLCCHSTWNVMKRVLCLRVYIMLQWWIVGLQQSDCGRHTYTLKAVASGFAAMCAHVKTWADNACSDMTRSQEQLLEWAGRQNI